MDPFDDLFPEGDDIVKVLEVWNTRFPKVPRVRAFYWAKDNSPDPRPQGRYLLCAWDGKNEYVRLYQSAFRRWLATQRIKWNSRDFMKPKDDSRE